jgi:hypothetical protein
LLHLITKTPEDRLREIVREELERNLDSIGYIVDGAIRNCFDMDKGPGEKKEVVGNGEQLDLYEP